MTSQKPESSGVAAWISIGVVLLIQTIVVSAMIGGLRQQVSDLAGDVHQIKAVLLHTPDDSPTAARR